VRGILSLADCPSAVGNVFNVGGREKVSISELAKNVRELLHSHSTISYIPYEKAYEEGFQDMERRVPDLSKIRNLVGYDPVYNLRDIILDVAEYQSGLRAAAHAAK
jgi:UDP-glucose 4-epimerase